MSGQDTSYALTKKGDQCNAGETGCANESVSVIYLPHREFWQNVSQEKLEGNINVIVLELDTTGAHFSLHGIFNGLITFTSLKVLKFFEVE